MKSWKHEYQDYLAGVRQAILENHARNARELVRLEKMIEEAESVYWLRSKEKEPDECLAPSGKK